MNEVFPIIPASSRTLWFILPIALLLLFLLACILYSSRNVQFSVTSEGLRIKGDLYGRLIPASSLVAAGAKPVDIGKGSPFQPILRTNGIGLPGYKSGWFHLRNGEKALLFVTDPSKVLYVPTRDGYALLLSTPDPEALRKSLHESQQKIAP